MKDQSHLPTGRLTLLFTDIEGSTRLLQRLGGGDYGRLVADHHRLLRQAISTCEGMTVKTEGDSFFAVFPHAELAVKAAISAQRALADQQWPQDVSVAVRMGIHSGEIELAEGEYVGLDVHRAARISNAGHGRQMLLSQEARDAVAPSLPAGVRMRDLGRHRLKDLAQPEHLYQLVVDGLPADFPPPRSLEMAAAALPQHLTAFFGRERELADGRELLTQSRLVTLTGAGGTGKTRLALQLAADVLGDFPDGVKYVPLAALREPELVLAEIARAFEVTDGDRLRERLLETIGSRQMLLILDNFEQLLPAAGEVARLLTDTPRLTMLITSRARLNVPGEREYVVAPLGVPDPRRLPSLSELRRMPAVALFVDRARLVNPAFELSDQNAAAVADICSRVDGLPLAIELAAARVRLISPEAICDRLSNRLALLATTSTGVSERQRTLRGTIAWSYDLLGEEEQALFRRLGVFLGGVLLPLVAKVTHAEDELELLEGLGSLIDKSLIRRADKDGWEGALRVEMLESIREFAQERLQDEGEAADYRERHALVFADLAEEAAPKLTGETGARWLDRLGREHDNMRAAFAWALEVGRVDVAVRLCAALWRFWQMRGHLTEGRERAEQAVAAMDDMLDAELRSRAFGTAGSLAYWQADWPAARAHYEAALEVERQRDDPRAVAEALYNLSFAYSVPRTDVDRALELAQEALATFRRVDDRDGVAKTLWALGIIANSLAAPRPSDAIEYYQEAAAIFEELGNRPMLAWARFMTADARTPAGEVEVVRTLTLDALGIFVELGDLSGYALCLHGLAVLEWVEGRHKQAARLAGVAHAIARSAGVNLTMSTSGLWLARFSIDEHALDPAALEADAELAAEWAAGQALSPEQAVAEAERAAAGHV